eukprot:jgi/Chlat1/2762/Chrsp187S00197
MASSLVWAAYPTSAATVVLFGLFALGVAFYRRSKSGPDTVEFFLTARRSIGSLRIGWSFYASAMGAWVLFGPPSYAYYAGITGLAMYAFSAGMPLIVVAFFGSLVHERHPDIMSIADYAQRRFGLIVQLYVSTIILLNMGIGLTAEYTAIGDLFEYIVGTTRIPIVIIEGVVASAYTAFGGLYVSIITDQAQAFISIVTLSILVIYVGVTFDAPEVFWQRCWAGATSRQLRTGSILGAVAVICATFLIGFGGFLAAWGNVFVPAGPDDTGNTILFSLLHNNWVIVITSVLAVTWSTSAVDSFQNAIVDTVSGVWLRGVPLMYIRALVLILNIPPIVVSLKGYSVLSLYLLANLVTTTSAIPLLLGLWRDKWGSKLVTSFSMLFGCLFSFASLFVYAKIKQNEGESYNDVVHTMFFGLYDYPPFVIALGFSAIGVALGACIELGLAAVFPSIQLSRWLALRHLSEKAHLKQSSEIDEAAVANGDHKYRVGVPAGDSSPLHGDAFRFHHCPPL